MESIWQKTATPLDFDSLNGDTATDVLIVGGGIAGILCAYKLKNTKVLELGPHLGCALKYNPAEHTWDCPCHGSRFTESGRLINNPATDDHKSINR